MLDHELDQLHEFLTAEDRVVVHEFVFVRFVTVNHAQKATKQVDGVVQLEVAGELFQCADLDDVLDEKADERREISDRGRGVEQSVSREQRPPYAPY